MILRVTQCNMLIYAQSISIRISEKPLTWSQREKKTKKEKNSLAVEGPVY